MSAPVLLDTGPLVAALDGNDQWHRWAYTQFERLPFPFLTCEAVLTEATHLLFQRAKLGPDVVLELVRTGAIRIAYAMPPEIEELQRLLKRYHDTPMDLADACLVRMAEKQPRAQVLTLDSDFFVYRTESGAALDVIPLP